jgi:CPA2 family monovalent cation:H+ antiporter-2
MFRSLSKEATFLPDLKVHLPEIEINTFRVGERAHAVGKSLRQIELRKKYGMTLLTIQRDHQVLPNPDADTVILAKDLLVVLALPANLTGHCSLFLDPRSEKRNGCDLSNRGQHDPESQTHLP